MFIHDTWRLHESPTSLNILFYFYDIRIIFSTTYDKEGDNGDLTSHHIYNLKSSITDWTHAYPSIGVMNEMNGLILEMHILTFWANNVKKILNPWCMTPWGL